MLTCTKTLYNSQMDDEPIDLKAWTYQEIAEMEAIARGFIAGILATTPYNDRKKIKRKLFLRDNIGILILNSDDDEYTVSAFGYHVDEERFTYSDQVYLCELQAHKIEFDEKGWGCDLP
jgi:hypothetical protein